MTGAVGEEADFLSELGQRVRHARAVRGLSRKLLSQTSGLSERYIAQLEGGRGNVSIILLRRVANALGMRLEDLVYGQEVHPDWAVIRDLVARAEPDQVSRAKALLSGEPAFASGSRKGCIALIGLRGAGKSTVGRLAAERLGWSFIELNTEIERENALSVKEIFALYGQDGYRRLEQKTLRRLTLRSGPLILATSGGIVAEPLTFDLLLQNFDTIWLRARPEEHMQRVRDQDGPLGRKDTQGDPAAALEDLRAVLTSREPLYARARTSIDTSDVPVDTMVQRLIVAIEPPIAAPEPPRRRYA